MVESELAPRKFSRMDAGRSAIALVLLAAVFAVWYFLLPWIQAVILPTAPGGVVGPWVVRPPTAVHFCACAILAAVSLPFLMKRLAKRWKAKDAAAGTRYDPFRNRPFGKLGPMVAGGALAFVYASALAFYLFSWTVVSPAGIEDRLPWGRRNHAFDQIASLEVIPDGMHSNELARYGPLHTVTFADGRKFTFGDENEGCSKAEVSTIAKFIAERSKQTWRVRADARPRK